MAQQQAQQAQADAMAARQETLNLQNMAYQMRATMQQWRGQQLFTCSIRAILKAAMQQCEATRPRSDQIAMHLSRPPLASLAPSLLLGGTL
jgi:hypothetical protein